MSWESGSGMIAVDFVMDFVMEVGILVDFFFASGKNYFFFVANTVFLFSADSTAVSRLQRCFLQEFDIFFTSQR